MRWGYGLDSWLRPRGLPLLLWKWRFRVRRAADSAHTCTRCAFFSGKYLLKDEWHHGKCFLPGERFGVMRIVGGDLLHASHATCAGWEPAPW